MDFLGYQLPVMLCIIIGIALLVFELFMPGVGIAGISGTLLLAGAVALLWFRHGAMVGVFALVCFLFIVFVTVAFIVRAYSKKGGRFNKKFGLSGASGKESSIEKELADLIGKEGEALCALRPSGTALIEGKRYNVISNNAFIEKGAKIKIVDVDGVKIVVENI